MSWNLQIHLKSNRDEIVYFDSQDEANKALDTLLQQMEGRAGLVTVSGSDNKLLVSTQQIETARVYEGLV